MRELLQNTFMLNAKVHSGGADVIHSGIAFSYLGESIIIEVMGLCVVFMQIKDKTNKEGIFYVSKPEKNAVYIELLNLKPKPYTVGPQNIGDAIEVNEHTKKETPKLLEIFFTVTPFKISHQENFKIEYTIFAVDL